MTMAARACPLRSCAALAGAIVATLAVAGADARAATAEVEFLPGAPVAGLGAAEYLRVRDDAGEANTFTVIEEETTSTLVIADARAPLAAGDGCQQIDRQRVRCFLSRGELALIGFDAGAFDDVVDLRGLTRFERAFVDGGSGDDLLHSGSTGGTLNGGPGRDTLIGRAGPDTFTTPTPPSTTPSRATAAMTASPTSPGPRTCPWTSRPASAALRGKATGSTVSRASPGATATTSCAATMARTSSTEATVMTCSTAELGTTRWTATAAMTR